MTRRTKRRTRRSRLAAPGRCQPGLDTGSPGAVACAGWVVRRAGVIFLLLPPRRQRVTACGLHPIGAGVVEPGAEVKLRLLDALDCQRLRASGLCSCGGGGSKDHAFSRCLTEVDGGIRSRPGESPIPVRGPGVPERGVDRVRAARWIKNTRDAESLGRGGLGAAAPGFKVEPGPPPHFRRGSYLAAPALLAYFSSLSCCSLSA
jgi:hypothetical protein